MYYPPRDKRSCKISGYVTSGNPVPEGLLRRSLVKCLRTVIPPKRIVHIDHSIRNAELVDNAVSRRTQSQAGTHAICAEEAAHIIIEVTIAYCVAASVF